jgi:hypothetical protein
MSDEQRPFQSRPLNYKTALDQQGGLVRVPLVGGLHEGRELFIDENELPPEIWTTPNLEPFEWWPERLREAMAASALAGDPANPPGHYRLETDEATREPRYVADASG